MRGVARPCESRRRARRESCVRRRAWRSPTQRSAPAPARRRPLPRAARSRRPRAARRRGPPRRQRRRRLAARGQAHRRGEVRRADRDVLDAHVRVDRVDGDVAVVGVRRRSTIDGELRVHTRPPVDAHALDRHLRRFEARHRRAAGDQHRSSDERGAAHRARSRLPPLGRALANRPRRRQARIARLRRVRSGHRHALGQSRDSCSRRIFAWRSARRAVRADGGKRLRRATRSITGTSCRPKHAHGRLRAAPTTLESTPCTNPDCGLRNEGARLGGAVEPFRHLDDEASGRASARVLPRPVRRLRGGRRRDRHVRRGQRRGQHAPGVPPRPRRLDCFIPALAISGRRFDRSRHRGCRGDRLPNLLDQLAWPRQEGQVCARPAPYLRDGVARRTHARACAGGVAVREPAARPRDGGGAQAVPARRRGPAPGRGGRRARTSRDLRRHPTDAC